MGMMWYSSLYKIHILYVRAYPHVEEGKEMEREYIARVMYAAYRFSVSYIQGVSKELGYSYVKMMPPHFCLIQEQESGVKFLRPNIFDNTLSPELTRGTFIPNIDPADWAEYGRYILGSRPDCVGYVIWGALNEAREPLALIKCKSADPILMKVIIDDESGELMDSVPISEVGELCAYGYAFLGNEDAVLMAH